MKTQIITLAVSVMVLSACQKEPEASISVNKSTVELGESVQFQNMTTDGESFEWDFGDGSGSTQMSPSKMYNAPGSYSVVMTAYSKNKKKSDAASLTVTVNPPPPDPSEKFVGTYSVDESFSSTYCGSGTYQYLIQIRKNGANSVYIDNFGDFGLNDVVANVNGTQMTIPFQQGMMVGTYTVDVVGGSGSISGNVLTFGYVMDDSPYTSSCGVMNGSCIATK